MLCKLPDELLFRIDGFLDVSDALALAACNKTLKDILASSPVLWKRLCIARFGVDKPVTESFSGLRAPRDVPSGIRSVEQAYDLARTPFLKYKPGKTWQDLAVDCQARDQGWATASFNRVVVMRRDSLAKRFQSIEHQPCVLRWEVDFRYDDLQGYSQIADDIAGEKINFPYMLVWTLEGAQQQGPLRVWDLREPHASPTYDQGPHDMPLAMSPDHTVFFEGEHSIVAYNLLSAQYLASYQIKTLRENDKEDRAIWRNLEVILYDSWLIAMTDHGLEIIPDCGNFFHATEAERNDLPPNKRPVTWRVWYSSQGGPSLRCCCVENGRILLTVTQTDWPADGQSPDIGAMHAVLCISLDEVAAWMKSETAPLPGVQILHPLLPNFYWDPPEIHADASAFYCDIIVDISIPKKARREREKQLLIWLAGSRWYRSDQGAGQGSTSVHFNSSPIDSFIYRLLSKCPARDRKGVLRDIAEDTNFYKIFESLCPVTTVAYVASSPSTHVT